LNTTVWNSLAFPNYSSVMQREHGIVWVASGHVLARQCEAHQPVPNRVEFCGRLWMVHLSEHSDESLTRIPDRFGRQRHDSSRR
jgi:hypothetical protein